MWLLVDDARDAGSPPRLYASPQAVVAAWRIDEVPSALEKVRKGLAAGKHAAGYLAYEAGHSFDPKLEPSARQAEGPLVCFGLFDGFAAPDLAELLPSPQGAFTGPPQPRISRTVYEAAAAEVRDHLFAGDFYQANLTFGCDVAVAGDPLALYARLRRSSRAGWGGVLLHDGGAILSLSPEQFFTMRDGMIEARPMKGTARRHSHPDADRAEAEALASD